MRAGDVFLERYRIDNILKSNELGQVYSGQDLHQGTPIVLKVTIRQDKSEPTVLQKLQKLRHPNVVELIDLASKDQADYQVYPYLKGVPLNQIVPKDRGLEPYIVWPIMAQIAAGVIAAHQAGILHLDLKPANVWLTKDSEGIDRVKILDFGIAQDAEQGPKNSSLKVGTPGYAAPEQFLGNAPLGVHTDVYALGALLSFMLTGKRAFAGDNTETILHNQTQQQLNHLHDSYLGESSQLQQVVQKALRIKPAERYLTVSDFLGALSDACLVTPETPLEETISDKWVNFELGRWIIGSVAVSCLLTTVTLYLWFITSL